MKKILLTALALGITFGISGCRTYTGKVIKDTPFHDMQKDVAKIGEKGGLAAIGIGQSSDMQISLEKAKVEARKNLAQVITVKVENLQKKFIEEAGDVGKKAEINQLFSSTTKIITSRELMGSMPKKQIMTEDDELFTTYVLMVVNPKVVADALEEQLSAQKAIYARYRASEGFKELGEEVKRYEAFKKEMDQMLGN
ncbi:hypothetical protein ACFLQY_03065 [Verrucomicrobiota bacterium]